MKVTNTCRRVRGEARGSLQFIGFAIKCNAIPRLTAKPAFGVIRPGQTLHINVTLDVPSSPLPSKPLQKFDPQNVNLGKDRFAFDYVNVPEGTEKFNFAFFQVFLLFERRRRRAMRSAAARISPSSTTSRRLASPSPLPSPSTRSLQINHLQYNYGTSSSAQALLINYLSNYSQRCFSRNSRAAAVF